MNLNTIIWFATGIILMLAELALPGFVVFFFGIGALVTSLTTAMGWTESFTLQLLVFIATSMLSLFFFRRKWSKVFKGESSGANENMEDIIGSKAKVITGIVPGQLGGKVEFRGTTWEAESDEVIDKGEVVRIIDRRNLKLKVKREV